MQMKLGHTKELRSEQVGTESFAVNPFGVHFIAVRIAGVNAYLSELLLERIAERVDGVRDMIHHGLFPEACNLRVDSAVRSLLSHVKCESVNVFKCSALMLAE